MVDTWHADAILDRLAGAMARGLDEGGQIAVETAKGLLDTPAPPPSRPGSPPHRRSGDLQEAQNHRVDREQRGATLHVRGTQPSSPADQYAAIVHRRRPWMRRSVDDSRARILDSVGDAMRSELR